MARSQSNGQTVSPIKEPASSAFGFIASTEPDNDDISGSTERPSEQSVTGFDFMSNGAASDAGPKPPSVSPSDFLVEHASIDQGEFEEMWESTNESYVTRIAIYCCSYINLLLLAVQGGMVN